ncbi:MAG: hypothetical protein GY944_03020 [bacterium]|nr:hypothetical protein [bacterium]
MPARRNARVGTTVLAFMLALALGQVAAAQPQANESVPVSAPVSAAPSAPPSAPRLFTNADLPSHEASVANAVPMLEWSKTPGVYEGELRRRYENPLYVSSRREIGEEELTAAKQRDAKKMWDVLEDYIGLANDKDRMARYEVASEMGDALLRIDEGTWEALRVGGEAYALAGAIQELRQRLLSRWREAAARDPGVKALLDAEARIPSVKTDSSAIRFLALIQTGGNDDAGPIRRYEFGTALVSEEPEAIRQVYKSLRGDLKKTVREQLARVLEDIGRDEIEFEGKDRKVAVVAKLLGRTPADFGIRGQEDSN